MCADANLFSEQEVDYKAGATQTCPANAKTPLVLQYIEHSLQGYQSTLGKTGSASYQFDWTPPATNVGNITIYVSANAGPATATPTQTGADVYTATFTLTPAAGGGGNSPTITDVQNGATFQPGIVPGSWLTLKGTNLSTKTDTWDTFIVNGKLPTTVDGVSVKVGGQDAYVYYVSPTQINVLVGNIGTGSQSVTVTNANGTTTATAAAAAVQPGLFLWVNKYAVATHAGACTPLPYCTWAVANGTFQGVTTTPAKPGETVVLWGTGFGPTSPTAPVGVPVPTDQLYLTSSQVSVTVNGTPADVYQNQAFLAPTSAGEYQLAVTIPANAPDGDLPVVVTINGAQSPSGVMISVHR
jgi:uncharacterized protein (TIGR03437 family)